MKYREPKRNFEDSGFVNPAESYFVNLENVVNRKNQDMKTMVDKSRYFSIFAPRQSGKTTFFKTFARNLEKDSEYIFILLSFENFSKMSIKKFYKTIEEEMYPQLILRLEKVNCPQLKTVTEYLDSHKLLDSLSFISMFRQLNKIIKFKKIVIFIDEFDGVPEEEIASFLTTLRKLYQDYKDKHDKALYSVGLVGIRNIAKLTVGGVSPFNIADHVELPSFSLKNIRDLYGQYTEETNQAFSEEAVQKILDETSGQPWLVNRLGTILTSKIKCRTTETINISDVDKAIDLLMEENNDHFNNLYEKIILFKETFKEIYENDVKYSPNNQSQQWLLQYGLIKNVSKKAVISNSIYKKRFSDISSDTSLFAENQQKKIFISYSHEDRQWLDKFVSCLNVLKHRDIEFWFDESIRTGDDWKFQIQNAIETSQVTICLISNSFLASDFIRVREIPEIRNKQREGMIVIPVILEECLWQVSDWLKSMQLYPKDGMALEEFNEKNQKKKIIEIVSEIGKIFEI